jgi:hypothetical protein
MMRHLRQSFPIRPGPALLLLAALLASAGCGGKKTATVSGRVTYQGKAVPMGAIYFHGPNDQMAMGILQSDGSFAATDVPIGQVKATVLARDPGVYAQQLVGPGGAPPQAAPPTFVAVPTKYADVNTTDLVFTIAGETKDLEVELR